LLSDDVDARILFVLRSFKAIFLLILLLEELAEGSRFLLQRLLHVLSIPAFVYFDLVVKALLAQLFEDVVVKSAILIKEGILLNIHV